ncbi:hypothetical protein B0H14DRAFT_3561507 [Mycena olivaceomarginata]|nr:hypothetical protein B0H14DRAFT_3561507 [Mycena olivaceomarginata]
MANLNLFRLAINLDPNRVSSWGWIVAEMRDKATKAKDATVKAVDTKDRTRELYEITTSVPLKNTNWDPYSKNPLRLRLREPTSSPNRRRSPVLLLRHRGADLPGSPAPSPSPRPGPPPIVRPSAAASGRLHRTCNAALPALDIIVHTTSSACESPRAFSIPTARAGGGTGPAGRHPGQAIGARTTPEKEIDWVNLSAEDKEVLFGGLMSSSRGI